MATVVAKKMSGGRNGEGLGVDVAVLNCLCACYIQPMPCMVLSELVARNCMTYQPGCDISNPGGPDKMRV